MIDKLLQTWTFLDVNLWGSNDARDVLTAVLVFVIAFVALRQIRSTLGRRLQALAAKTPNKVDDLIAELVVKTRIFFLLAVSAYFASRFLQLPQALTPWIKGAILILTLLQVAGWGNHLLAFLVDRYLTLEAGQEEERRSTGIVLQFLGRLLLWSLLLLMGLENLGFDVTALVTSLGIGGIAVALAVQNILGDIFASLSIVLDKPFVVGDFITVDNFACTVENIGLKTTRARSVTGEQVVFSNSDLLKSRLRNFKRMRERRNTLLIGVIYQTPPEKLKQIPEMLRDIVEGEQQARFDRAHFKEFGDSALIFELVYWITDPQYLVFMNVNQAVNLAIFERFGERGIEFAYPTRTLFLEPEGIPAPAARKKGGSRRENG